MPPGLPSLRLWSSYVPSCIVCQRRISIQHSDSTLHCHDLYTDSPHFVPNHTRYCHLCKLPLQATRCRGSIAFIYIPIFECLLSSFRHQYKSYIFRHIHSQHWKRRKWSWSTSINWTLYDIDSQDPKYIKECGCSCNKVLRKRSQECG